MKSGLKLYACLLIAMWMTRSAAMGQDAISLHEDDATASSSSPEGLLPEAPMVANGRRKDRSGMKVLYQTYMSPFSHVAVALNVGLGGLGFEVATPIANKWNLRGGVSFLDGSANFDVNTGSFASAFGATIQDGTASVNARPHFRNAGVSLDWFPRYGSFRISPGLTVYNGDRGEAFATLKGGEAAELGDGIYTSDPDNPIRIYGKVRFGRRVAPKMTMGWGNMLPRAGEHLSFPFEVGVQYVGRPVLQQLTISGNECDQNGDCYPVTSDPTTTANLLQEQREINGDLAPLRFYPILSSGVSYRF